MRQSRGKHDELSIENERLNNELAVTTAGYDQQIKACEHLQLELRAFKENERSLLQEKEELLRNREEGEICRK